MSATQDNPARADEAGPNPAPPGEEANDDPDPDNCENAQEYVLRRLDPTEPKSPKELADEYGCSNIHMQKTLADLADSGIIDRVSRGNYVADNVGDALEAGKDALSGTADTAADALDELGGGEGDADVDGPVPLPMDPTKLAKIIAIVLVLWLVYKNLYGGVDTPVETEQLEEDQSDEFDSGGLAG